MSPPPSHLVVLLWMTCLAVSGLVAHHPRSHFTHVIESTQSPKMTPAAAPVKSDIPPARQPCSEGGRPGVCVAHIQCPAHVVTGGQTACVLPSGQGGICCSTGQNLTDVNAKTARTGFLVPSLRELERCVFQSHLQMRQLMARTALNLAAPFSHRLVLEQGTPSFGSFQRQRPMMLERRDKWYEQSQGAMEMAIATKSLKERSGLTNRQLELGMMDANLRGTVLGDICLPNPECHPYKYRTLDGTCNNLLFPRWGSATGPMQRLLPPSYSDGVWSVRESAVPGHELPNARHISWMMFQDHHVPHEHLTMMIMQFGQFISHDITLSPTIQLLNGSGISCCDQNGSELPPEFQHFACYPIVIRPDDPFYSRYNQRCINFVRSMLAPRYDCTLGYAQQMNQVTHFLDGSMIYGANPEVMSGLRTFEGGRMQMFNDFNRDLLPLTEDRGACLTLERGSACFRAGDSRINQQITLVALHLLFTREHNRLAVELSRLNPHWSDETLFQESRRIVVAQLQHIMYAEWLPLILGNKVMNDYGLAIIRNSFSTDYDPNVNPSITNDFSAAAYRFGHSTVDGRLRLMQQGHVDEVIKMADVVFNPSKLRDTQFYDRLLMTLTSQPMQTVDPSLSESLNRYLFRAGNPFGVDLGAINIQRGRDHGVPPYNEYRNLLGRPRARTFDDFSDLIDIEAISRLRSVYLTTDDVDLFVAGLHERHLPGAAVGPTFAGIIADQFSRLRRGDRFFYKHAGHEHSFTPEQLSELEKVTMSRIICDNSDRIELNYVSPNAFLANNQPGNELVHCNDPRVPTMNLRFWSENRN